VPEQQGLKRRGAPKGNRNAAKLGEDLRFEMYLSKIRRNLFEEWFQLKFGSMPNEDDLREAARAIANAALDHEMATEFERHQPGRTSNSGEVF
jgi:ribosomal protein L29